MALSKEEQAELDSLRSKKASYTLKEDDKPTFGEKAGALAYGAATGIAGGLGELERFGVHTVPQWMGIEDPNKPETIFGRSGILPSQEEVESIFSKVGINKPREEVGGYKTAGEILGAIGPSIPGAIRSGGKALLGVGTKYSEELAKAAEKLGFKLSPSQIRQDVTAASKGAVGFTEHNQSLANRLASQGTGEEAAEITPDFIGGRLKSLGSEFNDIYAGKYFNIDQNAVDSIRQIAASEQALPGVAAVNPVKQAAESIVKGFDQLIAQGAKGQFQIQGEGLQRLRNALSERARSTGSNGTAHEIYNLIDQIDESVAKNHPEVAAKLSDLRPKYRNAIILEDLYKQGGIRQGNVSMERLGEMLRGKRGVVRSPGKDIDDLGELGRELRMRARWESAGHVPSEGEGILSQALGTSGNILSKAGGLQSRLARRLQRNIARYPEAAGGLGYTGTTALGEIVSPFNPKDDE